MATIPMCSNIGTVTISKYSLVILFASFRHLLPFKSNLLWAIRHSKSDHFSMTQHIDGHESNGKGQIYFVDYLEHFSFLSTNVVRLDLMVTVRLHMHHRLVDFWPYQSCTCLDKQKDSDKTVNSFRKSRKKIYKKKMSKLTNNAITNHKTQSYQNIKW